MAHPVRPLPEGRSRLPQKRDAHKLEVPDCPGTPPEANSRRTPSECGEASKGFTLVEFLVTLAVAAILVTVGIPSFRDLIVGNRLSTSANDLLTGLSAAKSEAIRTNSSIRFCLKPADLTWKVTTMASNDVRVGTLARGVTATSVDLDTESIADHVCVRFRPNGLPYGAGNTLITNGSITLTLGGKNRVVNVKTGALHVANS